MRATSTSSLHLPYVATLMIFTEEYKLYSCSLCTCVHLTFTSVSYVQMFQNGGVVRVRWGQRQGSRKGAGVQFGNSKVRELLLFNYIIITLIYNCPKQRPSIYTKHFATCFVWTWKVLSYFDGRTWITDFLKVVGKSWTFYSSINVKTQLFGNRFSFSHVIHKT
jgi:hypothetical protein